MATNHIQKVAIVGATGQQGTHIVRELLKTGKHTVTAITRKDSLNKSFPRGVEVAPIDYESPDTIVNALKGQDCLIITMNVTAPRDTSAKLVEAAAKAGVSWILPNEWGLDTADIEFGKQAVLGPANVAVRERINELGVSSWIAIACSFWYEYSLGSMAEAYGFDLQKREATFFDDGTQKINTSTWEQTARAVAGLLSLDTATLEKDWKNKFAYVSSFLVSQKDMLESLKRVTGTSDDDWKISYQKGSERYAEGIKAMKEGNRLGFVKAMYTRTFYPSGEGNFELKHTLANKVLGLPEEDLDSCTKGAIERSNMIALEKAQK